jgi:hypothetical protein
MSSSSEWQARRAAVPPGSRPSFFFPSSASRPCSCGGGMGEVEKVGGEVRASAQQAGERSRQGGEAGEGRENKGGGGDGGERK